MKKLFALIFFCGLVFSAYAQGKFGGGNGDGYAMQTLQSVPLGIQLLSFKASPIEKNQVLLEWITKRETNNAYFEVQKSADLDAWETLIKVDGKINSQVNQAYQVVDNQPYNSITYYRLKQTDFDGEFTFSYIISLNNQFAGALIKIFPNPSEDVIFIEASPAFENNPLIITDQTGKLIMSTHKTPKHLNIKHLTNGVYILKMGNYQCRFVKR
jgi:hypothetical protein